MRHESNIFEPTTSNVDNPTELHKAATEGIDWLFNTREDRYRDRYCGGRRDRGDRAGGDYYSGGGS